MARETIEERRSRLMAGAQWIRGERERRDWTGSELSRRLGISQERVSAYERAQDEPPADVARSLADVFGITELAVWQGLGKPLPRELADPEIIALVEQRYPGELDRFPGVTPTSSQPGKADSKASNRRASSRDVTPGEEPGLRASQA